MKPNFIFVLLLAALGAVAMLLTFTTKTQASPIVPVPGSLMETDLMCPLSENQLKKSMEAFEKMMPTFQHPRCANCHGGVLPFQANTNHAGGKFDLALDVDGDVLIKDTFEPCQACHSGLKGWEVPTADMAFVGKESIELCKQMKAMGNSDNFLDHIARDRGRTQFIATAFEGTRALNEAGKEFYEALNDKKLTAEPPTISHAALIEQSKAWVDALGGEFKGDERCGCELQRYALQVDESFTADFQSPEARLQWNGSTTTQIPLKFNDDGTFSGEITSPRQMNVILTSKVSCNQTETSDVKWQVTGKIDSEAETITFSIRFTPSKGFVQCGLVPMPLPIDDSENPNNPLKNVEMSSYIGETKTVELNTNITVTTSKDMFKITIIKLD